MSDLTKYDPMDPQAMQDPWSGYAARRSECPVAHASGTDWPFWMMFRYADIRSAYLDNKTWTARYGTSPVFQKSIGFFADGKDHTEFRNIFKQRLMPASLAKFEPRVKELAARQLDLMLAKGPHVELHDDFALPFPVAVISLLLGIPSNDYPLLKKWSDDLMDLGFGQDNEAFLRVYEDVCNFFDLRLEEREALLAKAGITDPKPAHVGSIVPDDWISDAVCGDFQGRVLTRPEQRIALMGLLVGGNETTTSLITNLMWRLLEKPERWARVREDPERLIPIAIEESLRFDPPALGMFRTSLCPVTVGGVEIPAKQKLWLPNGAANHDPDVFTNPEEFWLDRPAEELARHMAFGAGAHSCPGAPLSRMEVKLVMEMFVRRMPHVALDGPSERNVGFNFWGRKKLPLKIG